MTLLMDLLCHAPMTDSYLQTVEKKTELINIVGGDNDALTGVVPESPANQQLTQSDSKLL